MTGLEPYLKILRIARPKGIVEDYQVRMTKTDKEAKEIKRGQKTTTKGEWG